MGQAIGDWIDARRRQHRAGARARRKYRQLRKVWLRRNRASWVILALAFSVVGWGIISVINIVDGDHTWLTGSVVGAFWATFFVMRKSPPVSIASWEEGAFGEEETAKQLRLVEKAGWVVLHDLANGTANFDHVVLGPSGIYCLNSKWSGYRLEKSSDGRLVGRHRYDDGLYLSIDRHLRTVRGEAARLSEQIERRCGQRLWVQPVIVWWGEVDDGGKLVDGVGIVQGKHLAARLLGQRGHSVPRFDEVVAVLRPGRHARARRRAR